MSSRVGKRKLIDDKLIEKYLEEALESDAEFELDEPICTYGDIKERSDTSDQENESDPRQDVAPATSTPTVTLANLPNATSTIPPCATLDLPIIITEQDLSSIEPQRHLPRIPAPQNTAAPTQRVPTKKNVSSIRPRTQKPRIPDSQNVAASTQRVPPTERNVSSVEPPRQIPRIPASQNVAASTQRVPPTERNVSSVEPPRQIPRIPDSQNVAASTQRVPPTERNVSSVEPPRQIPRIPASQNVAASTQRVPPTERNVSSVEPPRQIPRIAASQNIAAPPQRVPRVHAGRPNILPAWTTQEYTPTVHPFDESNSGLKTDLTFRSVAGDVFEHFLNSEVIEKICLYTNNYAEKTNLEESGSNPNHHLKWEDVTPPEMYTFIALTMLMTRKKALELHEYWSTRNLFHQPIYSQVMTRDRYRDILTNLHYNDPYNENRLDKLTKLRPLLEHVANKFKSSFVPYQKLVIDESLILFKGRLQFKQYIPSKRSRFGVKLFVLCDTKTDFILQFIIYVGLTTDIEDVYNLGQSGAVVTTLLEDYLNNGHTLYVDNWYSSPALFRLLLAKKTNACGTVRKNCVGMPTFNRLSTGQLQAKYTTEMMAFKWVDRRDVHFLSTFHKNVLKDTGKVNFRTDDPVQKPEGIIDYNANMGSVDKTDMLLSSLTCIRKTKKWYKKVGLHIFDLVLLNAHASFKMLTARESYPLADFQFELIEQLILKHKGETILRQVPNHSESLLRLIQKHFPSPAPATQTRQKPFRNCHVCATTSKQDQRKRSVTRFMCNECNVALCVHPCFKNYHTLLYY